MSQLLGKRLTSIYKELFLEERFPPWAVKRTHSEEVIPPSIPFIGNQYEKSDSKIAVYASAENLSYYDNRDSISVLDDESAWNRHRVTFDRSIAGEPKSMFPVFHIAPVENGGLMCATLFLRQHLGLSLYASPALLAEETVFANIGKFSISQTITDGKNVDYIGNSGKLRYSLDYFAADLMILKPDIIVLPHRAWRHKFVRDAINDSVPDALVVKLMQCNSGNTNRHLKKMYSDDAQAMKRFISNSNPELATWTDELRDKNLRNNFYCYYAHMKAEMDKGCVA